MPQRHHLRKGNAAERGEVNVHKFLMNDEGAAGVEYGLLVAGIAAAIIVVVFTLGDQVANTFQFVSDRLGEHLPLGGGTSSGA